jgi:hypothetical protein
VLWNNRPPLEADDVLLPGRSPSDYNLATTAILHPHPRSKVQRRVRATWSRLREKIAAWSGDAVITNEWFVRATAAGARPGATRPGRLRAARVYTARAYRHVTRRLCPQGCGKSKLCGKGKRGRKAKRR